MGLEKLNEKLNDPDLKEFFAGLFPKDHPKNTRFAINFFTSIGLGPLTEELRGFLQSMPQLILNAQQINASSSSSSSSSSGSSSESSGESSSSDEDDSSSSEESGSEK